MNRNNSRLRYSRWFNMSLFLFYYAIALAIGYIITGFIYRLTGEPPAIWTHIFSGLSAVLIIALIGIAVMLITGHHKREGNSYDKLMEAMKQISQGNFDIIINPQEELRHFELVTAINDMAKNLGTLEAMRQDFISNVSHEIQSPLTSIQGFAVLLKNPELPLSERLHYADIIEAESKRLSGLSENLLKLSSLENNKIELNWGVFRLDKQLESVVLTLEPQWTSKNIELDVSMEKTTINGDEELLSQVWVNLIHNAIKFTPDDGNITVNLSKDYENAIIKVVDTGVGISPGDKIHIFERFYKVDKSRDRSLGGNGLGLALVKMIIDLHSGSISVESKIEKGTTFTVTLPLK